MQPTQNYLAGITANMKDDVVIDLVRQAMGPDWESLTELAMWTHYEDALSHRDDLRANEQLSALLNKHQASTHSRLSSSGLSSIPPTPDQDISPAPSPSPLDDNVDFAPTFDHILQFSTFVVQQAKYIYSLKASGFPAHVKPRIPTSLSYVEIVDAKYIAEIVSKAMHNPGEFSCNGIGCKVSLP
jgi:hypothetical protein